MQDKTDLREIHYGGDYDSDFECDETENKHDYFPTQIFEPNKQMSVEEFNRKQRNDLSRKEAPKPISKPNKQMFVEECSREEARKQKFDFLALDAYSKHKKLINEYILCYPGTTAKLKRNTCKDKTDHDIIRENHQFLWNEEDSTNTWQKQLAKKYYDKLFKEYCITDLIRYKENKKLIIMHNQLLQFVSLYNSNVWIALRWRTEQEVIDGKGQFLCGNKHCKESEGLRSWEINFKYMEHDEKKNALVKLRLCHDCSYKLNFHHKRKEIKQQSKRPIVEENITKKLKLSADLCASSSQVSESVLDQAKAFDEGGKETANVEDVESQIWKLPIKEEVEVCRDDEFEEYLSSMLL